MRVLHIGKFYAPFAGGIENFMRDLLPALQTKGVDTAAIVHDHRFGRRSIHKNNKIPIIFRVPSYGNLLYAPVSPEFPLALNQVIRTYKPDILHMHMPNTSVFWAAALPCARHIPWVIHWHSDVVFSDIDRRLSIAYRLYRPFEQYLLKKAALIVATSPPYLATSSPLSAWHDKCEVVPLGLDAERLKAPDSNLNNWAEQVWRRGKTRILSIGRLTYYKGHEVLIRAAAHMPDAHVLIVGQGDRKRYLKQMVAKLDLGERVTLRGFIPESKLQALLATCDCLCLPSIERTEAFGLVILEAMRYAKPVVAGNVAGSGMGWVVQHKQTGLLVQPGDPEDLAHALLVLAKSPDLRKRMAHAAVERFNAVFHIDRVAKEIAVMYQDVLVPKV